MNRRSFLRWFGIGTASVAAAPVIAKLPDSITTEVINYPEEWVDALKYSVSSQEIPISYKTPRTFVCNTIDPKVFYPGVKAWFDKAYEVKE